MSMADFLEYCKAYYVSYSKELYVLLGSINSKLGDLDRIRQRSNYR